MAGMVVRTNVMAMNANRSLGVNNTNVGKSLEKLSSGFRINRAADDASGLAISEKMKAQIKGLEQASANSQDGISLIQTAEGATSEIHNMLNRMTELATKSANGTIQDPVDREAIQNEINDLNKEISRIADSTNFNGINLLDGNLSASGGTGAAGVPNFSGGTVEDVVATAGSFTAAAPGGTPGTVAATAVDDKISYTVNYTDADGKTQSKSVEFTVKTAATAGSAAVLVAADGTEYTEGTTGTAAAGMDAKDLGEAIAAELKKDKDFSAEFKATEVDGVMTFAAVNKGAASTIDSVLTSTTTAGTKTDALVAVATATAGADEHQKMTDVKAGDVLKIGGKEFAVFKDQAAFDAAKELLAGGEEEGKYDGVNIVFGGTAATGAALATGDVTALSNAVEHETGYDGVAFGGTAGEIAFKGQTDAPAGGTGGLKLQVGDTNDDFNHVTVSVDDLTAEGLEVAGLDVSTQEAAGDSIETIKAAINKVSTNRGNLGSLQNRLEYTINNLDATAENMTAANSRIRDTDMAKEMMQYTKNNILTQAAQSMLAQANQQPQAILQLLG